MKQKGNHSQASCYLHHGAGVQSKTVAEHIGVSDANVAQILNGHRRVNPRFRQGLVELTDEATAQKIIDAIPAPVKKKKS